MPEDDQRLNDALFRAAQEVGSALTPAELARRSVRRVRFVPREKFGELLQNAVQKALDARAQNERGVSDLVDGVQAGLLGLLRGANEFESARRSVADERDALAEDFADLARMRSPGTFDERDQAIEKLERRVKKLVDALDQSERALQRALQSRDLDEGIESLYRVVQGLSANESQLEQKRAMMAEIFSANVAFQASLKAARRTNPVFG